MDEFQPSQKFVDAIMIQTGFHHDEADRPGVLTADGPSLASATGFQGLVAKAVKNQSPRYESGGIGFDQEGGLHGGVPAFLVAGVCRRADNLWGYVYLGVASGESVKYVER